MLDEGDRVPDQTVTLDDGRRIPFSQLHADGPLVLFFYPKAFTPGCTAQSCHFRDLSAEFAELGASRVGASRDDAGTQARFRAEEALDFPLIADGDGSLARLFGAKRPGPLWHKRRTVVVDEDGTVLRIISSERDMEVHADEALAVLRGRADVAGGRSDAGR